MRTSLLRWCATAAVLLATGGIALPIAAQQPAKRAARPPSKAAAKPSAKPADPAVDMLAVQVLLDRARFSPGEIDGQGGANTTRASEAFAKVKGLSVTDALSLAEPSTTQYVITNEDAAGPFEPNIPEDMMEKAKLLSLSFTSIIEALGERFHCDPALLKRLNPGAQFVPGESIVVPNVLPPAGPAPRADLTITVAKALSVLTVTDAGGTVLYHAPATTGSEHDPLPIGNWVVTGIARNPPFFYSPELFWDADPSHGQAKLPPGPNGPVGVVWIDLDKPHYGIHGTPEPGTVGHTSSHGCVRLTNWDAAAVANMVAKGVKVVFTE